LTREEVEAYLTEHIPLSEGMGVRVVEAGPGGVTLAAPLHPANVNHRSTAFGGSVAALAILAGWTLVHLRLRHEGIAAQTVIQNSEVRYDAPIHGTFEAVTAPVPERDWARFTRGIIKHGKGRVHVEVSVGADEAEAASFSGAYVAIRRDEGPSSA
jgi:thioesterase domain-containing protein